MQNFTIMLETCNNKNEIAHDDEINNSACGSESHKYKNETDIAIATVTYSLLKTLKGDKS